SMRPLDMFAPIHFTRLQSPSMRMCLSPASPATEKNSPSGAEALPCCTGSLAISAADLPARLSGVTASASTGIVVVALYFSVSIASPKPTDGIPWVTSPHQLMQMQMHRPQRAPIIPGRDAHHARPARGANAGAHGLLHGGLVDAVDDDLIHRVDALRQRGLDDAAQR